MFGGAHDVAVQYVYSISRSEMCVELHLDDEWMCSLNFSLLTVLMPGLPRLQPALFFVQKISSLAASHILPTYYDQVVGERDRLVWYMCGILIFFGCRGLGQIGFVRC